MLYVLEGAIVPPLFA